MVFTGRDLARFLLSGRFDADGANVLYSVGKMGLQDVIAERVGSPCGRFESNIKVGSPLLSVYEDDGKLRYAGFAVPVDWKWSLPS